ncbi:hypothetical protein BH24BAC1_BH24BAC1_39030 [soil metagenome]
MTDVTLLLLEILRITLPTLIIAVTLYFLVKQYMDREYKRRLLDLRLKNTETILPVRLQAYERVCLLLERITPSNLLIRVSPAGFTASEYLAVLTSEIRSEYSHNLSQQVYMTEQAWEKVKDAKEGVVTHLNRAYQQLPEDSKGTDLARRVLETMIQQEEDPTSQALVFIKREIAQAF